MDVLRGTNPVLAYPTSINLMDERLDQGRRVSGGWSALSTKPQTERCRQLRTKVRPNPDLLVVIHLRYSKDEDHKDIYIARYSDHQRISAAIYPCPICRQTFEKPSGLKRHYVSIRKYSLESRLRFVNI